MGAEPLATGEEIAGYRLVRLIARGGMGEVYEATQLSLDRPVALKFVSEALGHDERFRARFRREARLAAAIDHPSILPVYEAGELDDGRLYLAMKLVDGPDLSSLLRERGAMEPREAVALLVQVGDALDAAHERGLVHRDVKPANVLLEPRAQGWHAYLTDFGLAKPDEHASEHTEPGEILGTVDYMAPEQIRGLPVDGRADVYAFGCMVYRCVTGEVPFPRDSRTSTLIAHASAPVPIPSRAIAEVPAPLDVVVGRAMEKDPGKRAQLAGGLMRWAQAELDSVKPSPAGIADASTKDEAAPRRPRRHEPSPQRAVFPPAGHESPSSGLGWAAAFALSVAIYAPLWVIAYVLGTRL